MHIPLLFHVELRVSHISMGLRHTAQRTQIRALKSPFPPASATATARTPFPVPRSPYLLLTLHLVCCALCFDPECLAIFAHYGLPGPIRAAAEVWGRHPVANDALSHCIQSHSQAARAHNTQHAANKKQKDKKNWGNNLLKYSKCVKKFFGEILICFLFSASVKCCPPVLSATNCGTVLVYYRVHHVAYSCVQCVTNR